MDKLVGFLALWLAMAMVSAEYVETVATVSIRKGRSIYFPVRRDMVEAALERFTGPKLYLPQTVLDKNGAETETVLPNQPEGTHPLHVDIAQPYFTDYVDKSRTEVTISIPFLSLTQGGPIDYTLGMVVLTESRMSGYPFPKPEFLYNYREIDSITINDNGLVMKDFGGAELNIEFGSPCSTVGAETTVAKNTDYIFTKGGYIDYAYCGRFQSNQFCNNIRKIIEDIYSAVPNVCMKWVTDSEYYCEDTAEITRISGWFHDLIPITQTFAIVAGQYNGNYRIGAQFPCVAVKEKPHVPW